MIDVEQGSVAKLIDPAGVMLLWRVARDRCTAGERLAAQAFPSLLHIPSHVHFMGGKGSDLFSVVGTWRRDNLLDYFSAGPGQILGCAPGSRTRWSGAIGNEAAFPGALPTQSWYTRETGRSFAFLPADKHLFDDDRIYLAQAASWFSRDARRPDADDRDREGALSAARIAELWLDSVERNALESLNAFELEIRMRRMGMAAGDSFAQRFGWCHGLIGLDAVRGLNRLLAPWAAATFMPEPFRLGLLDRCYAHSGMCGVLLAAGAASQNFARAAADRATAPRSLPARGVKYVQHSGSDPTLDTPVHKIIKTSHGMPVFVPMSGHPAGLWELFIAVRVDKVMKPAIFRQPTPLVLRREMDSIDSIVVRVGERIGGGTPGEAGCVDVFFLSDGMTVADLDRADVGTGGLLGRAVRALWRSEH